MATVVLHCDICRNRLTANVSQTCLQPCNHSFCHRCFVDYCNAKQAGSVIRMAAVPCPRCRCLVDIKLHCSSPTTQPSEDQIHPEQVVNDRTLVSDDELDLPAAPVPTTSDINITKFVFPDVGENIDEEEEQTRTNSAPSVELNDSRNSTGKVIEHVDSHKTL